MVSEHQVDVLVIDDRREVATMLAELCEALGARTAMSEEGESVRAMLSRANPGGIIVDIMMPEEDGYEALREIARFDPATPVMLITGHGETWLRMGATLGRAHGLDHIETATKPVRADALRQFLEVIRVRTRGPGREAAPPPP